MKIGGFIVNIFKYIYNVSMENLENILKDITGKDEIKSQKAINDLIETSNVDLFKALVDKTDYLFDFIRNNINNRIEKAVNKTNYKNLIEFFTVYSPYYDDLFSNILSRYANEDLTDEIFELLEKGTIAQKTYAAKYFSYIPDTVAIELLSKYAFNDDENLSYNAAQSLGQMQDDVSYDIALGMLKNGDDFEKLKAVKFYTAYQKRTPLDEIFKIMKTSSIPENIAGLIPYIQSPIDLYKNRNTKENALITIDYILSGLGEILPLADIFQFELYDMTEIMIDENQKNHEFSGKIAEILLKMYSKFSLFTENQEYIFDESKDTKYEINSVYQLLKSQDDKFWTKQKEYILSELKQDTNRITSALSIISEYKIKSAVDIIKTKISEADDETLLCELLTTLKNLSALTNEDKEKVASKVNNPNIKAIIDNL